MRRIFGLLFIFAIASSMSVGAQCKIDNKYFQPGEELKMDLYFKYGLIYTKAGTSSLTMSNTTYNGVNAYKMTLMANSSGVVRKFFALNDTLISYTTRALVPLDFIKDAKEGSEYTQEQSTYTYSGGKTNIHTRRVKNGEQRFDEKLSFDGCVYDMISIVYYARTLDYSSMKKGDTKSVEFISGRKKGYMVIEHGGIEKVSANDDKKYECIKLVLSISDGNDSFSNKKEAMKVYITNDMNRMPVRLDSQLKVGSTRAILKSYKGNKYDVKTS